MNLCAGDQGELFDLRSDPYEQTNLFDDPAQRDRTRDMAARIRMWQHETRDVRRCRVCEVRVEWKQKTSDNLTVSVVFRRIRQEIFYQLF